MRTNIFIRLTLVITLMVTAFHLLIIVKLVPYDIAWSGRLKTDKEMYTYEIISIFVNLLLFSVLLMKGNYLKYQLNEKVVNAVLWIFFFVFILNTIGNLLANTTFEKSFSILTLILVILLGKILIKKRTTNNKPLKTNTK